MAECHTQFIPALVAWLILALSTATFFFFPCQYLQEHYRFPIAIIQGIITFFVFSNFFLAQFMDPGIIPKSSPDEVKDDDDVRVPLYKTITIDGVSVRMKWCITCRFYRPPRCSHCSVCDSCIDTFDHHCPWVNNCIGNRNYRHFFFFLLFLCLHAATILAWCIIYVVNHKEKIRDRDTIITMCLLVFDFVLSLPIYGLTIFHVMLVSKGRTTNEQMTGKFQNGQNPFTLGCWANWCNTLCGPHLPSYRCQSKTRTRSRRHKNTLHQLATDLEVGNHQNNYQLPEHQMALLPPRHITQTQPTTQMNQQQQILYNPHLQQQQQQQIQHLQQFQPQQFNGSIQQQPVSHQHKIISNCDTKSLNQQPTIMSVQQNSTNHLSQQKQPSTQQQQQPIQQSDPSQVSTQMQHVHYNSQSQEIFMDWQVY